MRRPVTRTRTFAGAPLQLSQPPLHERKLPAHRVRDLHHVELQLVARLHPLPGEPPSGQHHGHRGATVWTARGGGAITKAKRMKLHPSHTGKEGSYILVTLRSCLGPS